MEQRKSNVEKVGVAWIRTFKNGKEGLKISINKQIYVAYKNLKKSGEKDPDYIVVKFLDEVQPVGK